MTNWDDYGQQDPQGQPWPQQSYSRQPPWEESPFPESQYPPQGQPWQPPRYDPEAQQRRIGGPQYPPQGQQPWHEPGYGQPYPPQLPQGRPPRRRKSWPARHKVLTGIIAFAGLCVISGIANAVGGGNKAAPPANTPTATATVAASASAVARKPSFPPKTLADFRAFAATGDVSQVHQVSSSTEGLPSCPEPNFYVTVSPALTGQALEADLSAFFVQHGLLGSQCQAFVFAYHSKSDYLAHQSDGFTAGRVALTNTGSGSQMNLEVDAGSAVNTQAEFDFIF